MSNFKPLNIHKYQKSGATLTADTEYWNRLEVPTIVKEFGAIDYVDFSPTVPHFFAVTCSVRVQIYNPITKLLVKNLSRFQDTAYGGTFRQDGRLLAAGDVKGNVKLFDTSSKNVLRLFRGHKAAVHRVNFTSDLMQIVSYSDDKTVKLWDISNEQAVRTFSEHEDYVRAGAVNPISPNILVSGGYDGKITMYDTRMEEPAFRIDHGCPVESLVFLPTGGIFLSAGGMDVCVWDAFYRCRLLTKLTQHHKTVTCLRLGSNGKRILSSSLDRHVQIYDVATYQTVHTLTFPNSVLSLGIAPNDETVVAGMVDGLISIQNMQAGRKSEETKSKIRKTQQNVTVKIDREIKLIDDPKMANYNHCLRKYQYAKCLDIVMNGYITKKRPEVTVTVMQELIHRKGLHRALAGRDNEFTSKIIKFICRHIGEYRFMRVLIDVANILLDIYNDSNATHNSDSLHSDIAHLAKAVQKEMEFTLYMMELQGALELLMDSSGVNENYDIKHKFVNYDKSTLSQSVKAKETSIMVV